MSSVVVRAEGLGKKYVIWHAYQREPYVALRDILMRGAKNAWRRAADLARGRGLVAGDKSEEFWALKDVNFEVNRGEVLGVIGRNGAGKSTLLKILSRITEPTEGRVTIEGRVASLLEVGTGFHPELTGRENIFLNGAILGMSRAETKNKFDEIVAFAEVEKFLDTPVKRYSSGMFVRLAFAIAAHLEPEILMVDEVLAVGDAEFQKKCLGKMGEVAGSGRTVLFVSHNLPAVTSLCTRALVLNRGKVIQQGEVEKAIATYLGDRKTMREFHGRKIEVGARVNSIELNAADAVNLEFDVTLQGPLREPLVRIGIDDDSGRRIATIFTETSTRLPALEAGQTKRFRIVTEPIRLSPGLLLIKVSLLDHSQEIEVHDDALRLIVPEYAPFEIPPLHRPGGPVLLRTKVLHHEELPALFA